MTKICIEILSRGIKDSTQRFPGIYEINDDNEAVALKLMLTAFTLEASQLDDSSSNKSEAQGWFAVLKSTRACYFPFRYAML